MRVVRIGIIRRTALLAAVSSLVAIQPAPARQETLHPLPPVGTMQGERGARMRLEAQHAEFVLPAGWRALSPQVVTALSAQARVMLRKETLSFDYIGAASPGEPELSPEPSGVIAMRLPYLIVQTTPVPLGSATYDEIERDFSAATMQRVSGEVSEGSGGTLKAAPIGSPILDRQRHRIVTKLRLESSGEPLTVLAVTFLGMEGTVQLNFYQLDGDFDATIPQFEQAIDSFRFDEGYSYRPPAGTGGSGAGAAKRVPWGWWVAGGGVALGIVAGLMAAWRKKGAAGI